MITMKWNSWSKKKCEVPVFLLNTLLMFAYKAIT